MSEHFCLFCQKPAPSHQNYCSFDCTIALCKADGGVVHSPNGLPVRCIKYDGNMYEHEHGDHPDYKFPVEVEYLGLISDDCRGDFEMLARRVGTDDEVRKFLGETHALVYTDGTVALTLYECNYTLFLVETGKFLGGTYGSVNQQLSSLSRDKIRDLGKR